MASSLFVSASPAGATTMFRRSLRETVQISEAVLYGTIIEKSNELDSEGEPWTRYTLQVSETLMGSAEPEFTFRCYGGQRGSQGVSVVGIPTFVAGDRILLFYDADDKLCGVANWVQSAFRVVDAPQGPVLATESGDGVASLGAEDVVIGEHFPETARAGVEAHFVSAQGSANAGPIVASKVPAAGLKAILAQIKAFCRRYASPTAKAVRSLSGPPVPFYKGQTIAGPKEIFEP